MTSTYCRTMIICMSCILFFVIFLSTEIMKINAETLESTENCIVEDSGFLRLVNQENSLDSNFKPDGLIDYQKIKVNSVALDAYNTMLSVMEEGGITGLKLQSAYRPYPYQRAIFDQRVREFMKMGKSKDEAIYLTSQSIQYPGASEHQTGLALDVSVSGQLNQAFADTPAGIWLNDHCHKFGFIIRYPQNKTDVTHIIYEPWHLRYVGIPHASIMKDLDLSLEEYHTFLDETKMYIYWGDDGDYFLVIHTDVLPEVRPNGLIDVSSDKLVDSPNYIITLHKAKIP